MDATWHMVNSLLAERGAGAFIAGRDRFARRAATPTPLSPGTSPSRSAPSSPPPRAPRR